MAFGFSAAMLLAAQQFPEPVEIGSWLVAPADTQSCAAVAEFVPNLMVSIREDAARASTLIVSDDRWRLAEGQQLAGTISWDNWVTSEEVRLAGAKTASGRWYLAARIDGFGQRLSQAGRFALRVPGLGFDRDFGVPNAREVTAGIQECAEKMGR